MADLCVRNPCFTITSHYSAVSRSQETGELTSISKSLLPEIIILNMSELFVQNGTTGLTSVSGTIQNKTFII